MNSQRLVKRAFDLSTAAIILLVALPLLAIVALAILATMGRPILFRQKRPGLHGNPYVMYKFRTMRDARGDDGQLLPDGRRLTRLGRLLRHLSLDELPEFFNVLRGDMSLVGPRPLLMEYLDRYTPQQARRHEVKPGITGWAQVNGRNAVDWEERFKLDLWYVENACFWLDVRILFRTIGHVIRCEGIHAPAHETMPEFRGLLALSDRDASEAKAR
ncbi:MAG: sugar transferase [Pirellulales bacterium]|nr:sugar transferase [Pirellulales bacterium]